MSFSRLWKHCDWGRDLLDISMIILPSGKPPESLLISLFLFMQNRKAVTHGFYSFLDEGSLFLLIV